MTILTLDENDRAAVIECGTNRLGEIRRLNAIVQPDVTLVLNVDIEHTEGLGSLENIADEEAALFKSARVAVFPAADRMLAARIPTGTDMITFGDGTSADVRLTGREMIATGGQRIALELAPSMVQNGVEPKLDVLLNLPGRACANNAAAAVAATAAAWRCPLGREELAAMARALASVRPVEGRLCTRQINGIVVIDDTYNANPSSVRAALAVAREMADGLHARLIVALGDMLELGALSAEAHAEVLRATFNARPDAFVAVGLATADAVKIVDGRGSGRPAVVVTAADSDEAGRILRPMVRPGDVLLLKGSRGIAMERVAAALA